MWVFATPATSASLSRCDNEVIRFERSFLLVISRFSVMTRSLAILLAITPVLGCRAQTPPAGSAAGAPQAQLDRRIQLAVRAELNVPPNWEVQPGARTPSEIPGYDNLQINFFPATDPSHSQSVQFLLAKDGQTLARLSKYSLTKIPGTDIDTTDRPIRGNKSAKIEIVNFDDLECPFCARMHAELFPETLDHYKGLVKIVYKDDPLVQIHPWAMRAAVNANCLATQNGTAYWNYVDYLHTHGEDVSGPDRDVSKSNAMLDRLAREEGTRSKLNAATLDACITKQDETKIRAEMADADRLGIDGTPQVFVDGEKITAGAQPTPYLWAAIDRALKAQGITPPPNPDAIPATPQAAPAANSTAQVSH